MKTRRIQKSLRRWAAGNADLMTAVTIFAATYGLLLAVSPFERNSYAFGNYMLLMAPLAIAAAGATLVLVTGGFDLSVAGVISLSNVLAATMMEKNPDNTLGIALLIIAMGLSVGLINGLVVVFLKLQSLAVTLASFICLTGIALVILPAPGGQVPLEFTATMSSAPAGIPSSLIVFVVIALAWVLFKKTRTGVAIFALGADKQATLMSGVAVRSAEVIAYTAAGGLYAMAGLYLTVVTASGDPNSGRPFLLTVFAALALGLVSFRGGAGSAIAAMFGAATLMAIPKLFFGLGIEDFWVGAFQGVIILLALSLPIIGKRLRRRPDRQFIVDSGVATATTHTKQGALK